MGDGVWAMAWGRCWSFELKVEGCEFGCAGAGVRVRMRGGEVRRLPIEPIEDHRLDRLNQSNRIWNMM